MIDEKLNSLNKDRKEISHCDDFDKINVLWNNISKNYKECKEALDVINKEINDLINNNEPNLDITNMNFSDSFQELKNLSENIKNCPISNLSENIKKLKLLKTACLLILKQKKCTILEGQKE